MRVLLVEDDDHVAAALVHVLRRHGFEVARVATVGAALRHACDDVDVFLLDLVLPDGDGLSLCQKLRSAHDTPILITTARQEVATRVHGLSLGADDYLVKPFDVRELVARIHAVTRRAAATSPATSSATSSAPSGDVVTVRDVTIDLDRQHVEVAGEEVALTRKEFAILAELARSPGLVVRRERILSRVWQSMYDGDMHTLNVHMTTLRAKLARPDLIHTVRGVGYRLSIT